MSKINLFFISTFAFMAASFCEHPADKLNDPTFMENLINELPYQSLALCKKLPMASIISTPNVVYVQTDTQTAFVAYYSFYHTITILDGENYGLQFFWDDEKDELMFGTKEFQYEEMDGEIMMVHKYDILTVYSGKAVQIIRFED